MKWSKDFLSLLGQFNPQLFLTRKLDVYHVLQL